MQVGGDFMLEDIAWFNGGLFQVIEPIPLDTSEVKALLAASNMNWSHIEPSIFGTMFERGLDPAMRSQLGANYTDPGTIGKLVDPVIVRPLAAEWDAAKEIIDAGMAKYHAGGKGSQAAHKTAQETFLRFIERLKDFRVLDPACGSGNFLYLALRALKNLEHRANLEVEAMGLQRQLTIETNPANVLGIEINAYAAELARVTVWIGEIQWMLKNGYDIQRRPILAPLNHIECRDALLNSDGTETEWPEADAIIGNPPFLGGKMLRNGLGDAYVDTLFAAYAGSVPQEADLVIYWFEKANTAILGSAAQRAGLVATNSIRGGANRKVLDRILSKLVVFEAWSDEPWINQGAAVRVSLVAFGHKDANAAARLNGINVAGIHADLTGGGVNLTTAVRLKENAGIAFMGDTKGGAFDVPGELARKYLQLPRNPNGQPNSRVLRPWVNGLDLMRRPRDMWIVDFGWEGSEQDAAQFEAPFEYAVNEVKPERAKNQRDNYRRFWWRHVRARPGMWKALESLDTYIATPTIAKHRLFVLLPATVCPDHQLIVIARADSTTFGILHSRFHELWALRMGTSLEDRPRYTPTTTFETFPFPIGMTPRDTAKGAPAGPKAEAIADAARNLNTVRENWLNPPEWVDRVPEVVAGYPERIVAKPGHEAELKKRTLTNLYNARPSWLDNAHKTLDVAVAQAYGWKDYTAAMPDEEILRRLLDLNLQRATKTRS